MPLSSRNYTLLVKEGETLESIARDKSISLDELSGANPNVPTKERLKRDQVIFLPGIETVLRKRSSTKA